MTLLFLLLLQVRNAAIRTLFQSVVTHGTKMSTGMWRAAMWSLIFPLVDAIRHQVCPVPAFRYTLHFYHQVRLAPVIGYALRLYPQIHPAGTPCTFATRYTLQLPSDPRPLPRTRARILMKHILLALLCFPADAHPLPPAMQSCCVRASLLPGLCSSRLPGLPGRSAQGESSGSKGASPCACWYTTGMPLRGQENVVLPRARCLLQGLGMRQVELGQHWLVFYSSAGWCCVCIWERKGVRGVGQQPQALDMCARCPCLPLSAVGTQRRSSGTRPWSWP